MSMAIQSMNRYWASANRFFQSVVAEGGNKYPDGELPPVPDPELAEELAEIKALLEEEI